MAYQGIERIARAAIKAWRPPSDADISDMVAKLAYLLEGRRMTRKMIEKAVRKALGVNQ